MLGSLMEDTIQEEGQIPLLFNEKYLKNFVYKDNISIIVYCQLQLIFDYFDSKAIKFHLLEKLLISLKKIQLIKVPNFDQMAQTIRTKNVSTILQFRRKSRNLANNRDFLIKESKREEEEEELDEPILPKTFDERKLERKLNVKQNNKDDNAIPKRALLAETFWNQRNINYTFQDGILFKENDRFDSSSIKSKRKLSLIPAKANIPPFILAKRLDIKSNQYKFFYFNEIMNKWQYNESEMSQFCSDKGINFSSCDVKIPLVFIFNSDENDSVNLCSNMINYSYPDLDNQICIYGLCDRPFSLLNYNLNTQFDNDMNIKPIFLLLHVPKSKQNYPNIGRILFQIYSFLFIIANIAIVIISESNSKNQLTLFKDIIDINSSYDIKDKKNEDVKMLYESNIDEEYEFSEDESIDEPDSFLTDDFKTELFSQFKKEFIKKEKKFIFLFNSDVTENNQKLTQNNFEKIGKSLLSKYKNIMNSINFSVINVCKPKTYESFLNVLNSFARECFSQISEIHRNFLYLPLFEMSNTYINFKQDNNYAGELVKTVYARFPMIKESKNDLESDFTIIPEIQKEMHSIYPLFDVEFSDKINSILVTLQYQITKEKNIEISNELKISSESQLKYLSKIIKKEAFWTKQQIVNIKNNHSNFLKEEFFSIIKALYPPDMIIIVFNDNMKIVDAQIEEDDKKIQDMFGIFFKKLDQKSTKEVKLEEGTNYTIRERENEREIKVRVEIGGSLEDLIEQDF